MLSNLSIFFTYLKNIRWLKNFGSLLDDSHMKRHKNAADVSSLSDTHIRTYSHPLSKSDTFIRRHIQADVDIIVLIISLASDTLSAPKLRGRLQFRRAARNIRKSVSSSGSGSGAHTAYRSIHRWATTTKKYLRYRREIRGELPSLTCDRLGLHCLPCQRQ